MPTFSQIYKFFLTVFLGLFIILFPLLLILSFPLVTRAETNISQGYLTNGGYWTKQNSPYILKDNITVPLGQKLTIMPGVTVLSDPVGTQSGEPYSMSISGDLDIFGSREEPVNITGLGKVYLGKNNKIDHAIFENTGLSTRSGTTTISNSKITGASIALDATSARVDIKDSDISKNKMGIFSRVWLPGPFLVFNYNDSSGIGGIGNVLDVDPVQNIINIHNTVFEGNEGVSIRNLTANTIDATDNWWGSPSGPGIKVLGPVRVDPWQVEDPKTKPDPVSCCSNVLFLPGFEGSRQYKGTNRLWEPNVVSDVRSLYLDENGKSLDQTIYTKDIIDAGLGVEAVYKKFISKMDALVENKTINSWLPFAYDWRMNVTDILPITQALALASSSRTGKITIVAHSNGGLVAKMLGHELEKIGKENIIDKVILVGVPQLGTPMAVTSMLHGFGQDILAGLILPSYVARTFGLNMPGAYGLLPSQNYFSKVFDPIITLADGVVDSYDGLTKFLTGESDSRTQPTEKDLRLPSILSSNLLSKSQWVHSIIDNWKFPDPTKVFSVVGWGSPTISGLDYKKIGLSAKVWPVARKTIGGDGIVINQSAESYGEPIYFNQGLLNHDNRLSKEISHMNLLEADDVEGIISRLVGTTTIATYSSPYISLEKPKASDYPWMRWLTVSVHSPVDIDVYGSKGGHIGMVPLPDYPDSEIKILDNTLGGQFEQMGEEKFVTLLADDTYTVKLKGKDFGTFIYKVQKFVGDTLVEVASTTFYDLPVTPTLIASTTVSGLNIEAPLKLDIQGDGVIDSIAMKDQLIDPKIYFESLRMYIKSLKISESDKSKFLKRINKIETDMEKDKTKKVIMKISDFMKKIEKYMPGQEQNIEQMLSSLLENLEQP